MGCRIHVPGWHEATQELRETGRIQMVGIVEEQHPDRARLFAQWKGIDWPILQDPLNLLQVPYVPITLSIDERGVVRKIHPVMAAAGELDAEFLEAPPDSVVPPALNPREEARRRGKDPDRPSLDHASSLLLRGGEPGLDEAVRLYQEASARKPDNEWLHFRLGVALRKRYDSGSRQEGDFQRAVEEWSRALEIDPNNYIFRRRIQQYGPRLAKPYPFYDWVSQARDEIAARGETPVPLGVEPRGAELAHRISSFPAAKDTIQAPDPGGRIHRDTELIEAETTVVPSRLKPGSSARVHVVLRPSPDRKAHWNNEVDDTVIWVEPPAAWSVDAYRLTVPNPKVGLSRETRRVEFEVSVPGDAPAGPVAVSAYALYYVCEDVTGVCLYRRQDLNVELRVMSEE